MDIKEIDNMSLDSERKHWWIRTRFNYIDKALGYLTSLKGEKRIVEFGCGTAQNLWYARTQSPLRSIINETIGLDPNLPDDFKGEWQTENDRLESNISTDQKADLVMGLDVLEHIDDDKKALSQWRDTMNPNGVMLITVPAFQSLWSRHDELLDHKRRYTKAQLGKLADEVGLKPIYLSYAYSYLFLPAYLIRKVFQRNSQSQSTDLVLPSAIINETLSIMGKIERILGGCPFFGTSVVGIFVKK